MVTCSYVESWVTRPLARHGPPPRLRGADVPTVLGRPSQVLDAVASTSAYFAAVHSPRRGCQPRERAQRHTLWPGLMITVMSARPARRGPRSPAPEVLDAVGQQEHALRLEGIDGALIVRHQHDGALVGRRAPRISARRRRVEVVRRLVEQQHVGADETTSRRARAGSSRRRRATPAGFSTSSPEKRKEPSTLRTSVSRQLGAAERMFSRTVRLGVERLVLLGVVAELEAVPRLDLAGVGLLDAGEHPQQGRLAGTVEAEDHDPRAPVDRQVDVGEDLQRAVRLRQPRRATAASCRTAPASGSAAWRPCRRALASSPASSRSARLAMFWAADGLGRLGPHLVGLREQGAGLLLRVGALALAAPLVGLALLRGRSSSPCCRCRARRGWRRGERPC